ADQADRISRLIAAHVELEARDAELAHVRGNLFDLLHAGQNEMESRVDDERFRGKVAKVRKCLQEAGVGAEPILQHGGDAAGRRGARLGVAVALKWKLSAHVYVRVHQSGQDGPAACVDLLIARRNVVRIADGNDLLVTDGEVRSHTAPGVDDQSIA